MLVAALLAAVAFAPAPAPCTHAQIRLRVGGGNGAAGTVLYPLTFVNRSAHACTLRGVPGVSSVTRAHRQVGTAAGWDPGPRQSIRLSARGGTATAALGIVNALNFPRSTCRPRRVWGLRVYAPGQRQAFFARLVHLACSRPAVANMHVRPVVRGRSGL
jgi:hypothetical protein